MGWFKYLLPAILLFVYVTVVPGDPELRVQFYGGSLSYSLEKKQDGKYMVDLELISGWVLGKGPCGTNCTSADVGRSTKTTRQHMLDLHNDPSWLGLFHAEYRTNADVVITEMNDNVTSNYTARVFALSESAKWEQELLKSSFPTPNDEFDLTYDGHSWTKLRIQGEQRNSNDLHWHFQVKITTKIRSDTGRPNQCPRGFAKAFYRVTLDEITNIQIQVADEDDDIIKCRFAQFVEGGLLSTHTLPNVNVYDNCTVRVNASRSAGYRNEDWIGIPVIVEDFTKYNIKYGLYDHPAVKFSLCQTSVQFTVNILENLKTPVFIPPTKEENHLFIIYENSRWETTVYALPALQTTLVEFVVFGLKEEEFLKSAMYQDNEEGKHLTVSWTPNAKHTGLHFCCIRVVDNNGVDADRCFKLEVRPDVFNYSYVQVAGRPYFIDIPSPDEYVNCELAATCLISLYVRSSNPLKFINITENFTDTATLGQIDRESRNGDIVSTTILSFTNSAVGRQKICLMALDINGLQSEKVCMNSEILPLDPCLSAPCFYSATCRSDRNKGTLICQCLNGYEGKFCEIRNDNLCEPGPCIRENTKSCIYVAPHPVYCLCFPAFAGDRCETNKNDCKKDTCNLRGICKDLVNNTSCECYQRYSGARCTVDACPTVPNTGLICPTVECANDPCSGNGVCISGGKCICSIGNSGSDCSTALGILQVQGSVEFIPPTPKSGGSITCYMNTSQGFDCRLLVAVATRLGIKPTLETTSPGNLTIDQCVLEKSHVFREVNNVFSCTLLISGKWTASHGLYICVSARIR